MTVACTQQARGSACGTPLKASSAPHSCRHNPKHLAPGARNPHAPITAQNGLPPHLPGHPLERRRAAPAAPPTTRCTARRRTWPGALPAAPAGPSNGSTACWSAPRAPAGHPGSAGCKSRPARARRGHGQAGKHRRPFGVVHVQLPGEPGLLSCDEDAAFVSFFLGSPRCVCTHVADRVGRELQLGLRLPCCMRQCQASPVLQVRAPARAGAQA